MKAKGKKLTSAGRNTYNKLLNNIGVAIEKARHNAVKAVNTELVKVNWEIGRYIIQFDATSGVSEHERGNGAPRAYQYDYKSCCFIWYYWAAFIPDQHNDYGTEEDHKHAIIMKTKSPQLRDGDSCKVIAGTHAGKSGTVRDINTSKTGHITITVEQKNGDRFKTLGKNVEIQASRKVAKAEAPKSKPADGIHKDIKAYNSKQEITDRKICNLLAEEINGALPKAENKIWHAHPVWFLEGNPIVGYDKLKTSVRLLFWSGQSFEEEGLKNEGSFKAAEARYTSAEEINTKDLKRWLKKSIKIQWDYKNIVKRKGKLERLK